MVPPRLRRSICAIAAAPPFLSYGVGVLPSPRRRGHGHEGAVVVAVTPTHEAPGSQDHGGLFGGPATPGVQRLAPAQPPTDRVHDSGTPEPVRGRSLPCQMTNGAGYGHRGIVRECPL